MPDLKCTVESCVYNKTQCCCKGDIKVDGCHADDPKDTCCGSFREKNGESYTNAVEQPEKKIDVYCEAVTCVYNADKKCSANKINISGNNACKCTETECASFSSK